MIRPQWEWAVDDGSGAPVTGTVTPVFANQYDAEQWLGEHWRELVAAGAVAARLLHDGAQAAQSVQLPSA